MVSHEKLPLWDHVLSLGLKIVLAAFATMTFLRGEYVWFIGISFSLFLTLIPTILARDFNVKLPWVFDVVITVSVFFHVVGGYTDWYANVPYYDHFTHFISSATVSLIGVTFLYILNFHTKIVSLPPLGFGIFTVLFSMSMGVIWEFMEWGFDLAFDTGLQLGLQDTMWDFVFDTVAGVLVAVVATVKLNRGKRFHDQDEIVIGDIKRSTGYIRWKMLTDADRDLQEKIRLAFKDPIVLEGFFDYIVAESKHISKEEERLWSELKKRIGKRMDDLDDQLEKIRGK